MSLAELQQVFFQDPRWAEVEEMIFKFINPLTDMSTLDLKQPPEHVKAEVIGRMLAHNALKGFLESTRVVPRPIKAVRDPWA